MNLTNTSIHDLTHLVIQNIPPSSITLSNICTILPALVVGGGALGGIIYVLIRFFGMVYNSVRSDPANGDEHNLYGTSMLLEFVMIPIVVSIIVTSFYGSLGSWLLHPLTLPILITLQSTFLVNFSLYNREHRKMYDLSKENTPIPQLNNKRVSITSPISSTITGIMFVDMYYDSLGNVLSIYMLMLVAISFFTITNSILAHGFIDYHPLKYKIPVGVDKDKTGFLITVIGDDKYFRVMDTDDAPHVNHVISMDKNQKVTRIVRE